MHKTLRRMTNKWPNELTKAFGRPLYRQLFLQTIHTAMTLTERALVHSGPWSSCAWSSRQVRERSSACLAPIAPCPSTPYHQTSSSLSGPFPKHTIILLIHKVTLRNRIAEHNVITTPSAISGCRVWHDCIFHFHHHNIDANFPKSYHITDITLLHSVWLSAHHSDEVP